METQSDAASSDEVGTSAFTTDRFIDDEEDLPPALFKISNASLEGFLQVENESRHQVCTVDDGDDTAELDMEDGTQPEEVEECFKAAVKAYLQSLPLDTPGYNVLKEIQFIADCMGYSLFVRTSVYLGEKQASKTHASNTRVLQKGILKCDKYKDRQGGCPFSMTVKTVSANETGQEGCFGRLYVADYTSCVHSHRSSYASRRPTARTRAEAPNGTNILQMSFKDTIRFLEDKYKRPINFAVARKHVGYATPVFNPMDRECLRLCDTLSTIINENIGNKVFLQCDDSGRMKLACWSFDEWIEEYDKFGIVPGVSIDCKVIANRFGGFQLVTINGKANDGCILTFFMAFMSSETEENFVSVLKHFKSIIPLSPCMITTDENTACISAVEKVFQSSYIALDEHHLNQHQMRNVTSWCSRIKKIEWRDEMSKDLFNLRRSDTVEKFIMRRLNFEQKYIVAFHENMPIWYQFLYHLRPFMVVSCFRNDAVPRRFLFQGTGYTETSNAGFKAHIVARKVPLWQVPSEIRRISQQGATERRESSTRPVASNRQRQSLMGLNHLPLPEEERVKLCHKFTSYALSSFSEISVASSKNYVVASAKVLECGEGEIVDSLTGRKSAAGPTAQFELKWVNTYVRSREDSGVVSTSPRIVSFGLSCSKGECGGEKEIVCRCSCNQMQRLGFPCRHIVRVATVYPEQSTWNPALTAVLGSYIPISQLFDRYWQREARELTREYVSNIRLTAGVYKGEAMAARLLRANGEGANVLGVHEEVTNFMTWIKIKDVSQSMYQEALRLGPAAVESVRRHLDDLLGLLREDRLPSNPSAHNFQSCASGTEEQALTDAIGETSIEMLSGTHSHAGQVYAQKRNEVFREPFSKRARTAERISE